MLIPRVPGVSVFSRIANGDASAADELITQHGALVWSIARRMTRVRADAEDATQEILLELWRHASRFDGSRGSEAMFVTMIARRRLIDRLRGQRTRFADMAAGQDQTSLTSTACLGEQSVDGERVSGYLRLLKPTCRRAIEMSVLEGLTHQEIAAQLQLPLGSVKSLIRRGLMSARTAFMFPQQQAVKRLAIGGAEGAKFTVKIDKPLPAAI